jgi:hypothetical protein
VPVSSPPHPSGSAAATATAAPSTSAGTRISAARAAA